MPKFLVVFVLLTVFVLHIPAPVRAYQPMMEEARIISPTSTSLARDIFASSIPIGDPTSASEAIFGKLATKNEIDMYVFVPRSNTSIPVELTVPSRKALIPFRPVLMVIGKNLNETGGDIPFILPLSYDGLAIASPRDYDRKSIFDSFAFDSYFAGTRKTIEMTAKNQYFLAVWEPNGYIGPYKLAVGDKQSYEGSVKDTAPKFYISSLAFDDVTAATEDEPPPADWEQKQFIDQKSPYQTVDSKLRLGFEILRFYIFRLGQVLAL